MKIFEYIKTLWNNDDNITKPKKIKNLKYGDCAYLCIIPRTTIINDTLLDTLDKIKTTNIPLVKKLTVFGQKQKIKVFIEDYQENGKMEKIIKCIFQDMNFFNYLTIKITSKNKKNINKTIIKLINYDIYITTDKKQIYKLIKQYSKYIHKNIKKILKLKPKYIYTTVEGKKIYKYPYAEQQTIFKYMKNFKKHTMLEVNKIKYM